MTAQTIFVAAAPMIPCSIVLSSREEVVSLQEVVGRPARHHGLTGTRARVELQATSCQLQASSKADPTYKVYLRCSSISMIAAWLPHR
jgi:hypothetical protein